MPRTNNSLLLLPKSQRGIAKVLQDCFSLRRNIEKGERDEEAQRHDATTEDANPTKANTEAGGKQYQVPPPVHDS